MVSDKINIYNGSVITPSRILSNGSVLLKGKHIIEISESSQEVEGALNIDARGNYISPGFIELHVHGGGGSDFMDGTVAAFLTIAETHLRHGTTSMYPTTLTCSHSDLLDILNLYDEATRLNTKGARFLGMHLEGPYFALSQSGAQDPRFIRNPDEQEYKEIINRYPYVKRWSIAPELNGALSMGQYLRSKGIIPSIAHTEAVYEDVLKAFDAGYRHVTHLYSGMPGVTRRNAYRYAGVVESAYLMDDLTVEIIADGIHLPPPLLKLVYKIKGADRTALITDSMRAGGTRSSKSTLGNINNGLEVIIEDGVAKLPDKSAFAGSVVTADKLVYNMMALADVPLIDAVKMITSTPAKIMGISEQKGSLAVGKDADLVIFDSNINIFMTIVEGRVLYQNQFFDSNSHVKHHSDIL